jgi:hypothetical protein
MEITTIRDKLHSEVEIPHPAEAGFGMTNFFCFRGEDNEDVSKDRFYPQTPQGGLSNSLIFNKSPLGDLGVDIEKGAFKTAPLSSPYKSPKPCHSGH